VSPHKRSAWPSHRHYPRMARVNEVLREVLADEIELVAGSDPRLELVTVTAVSCDPDLRHATVLLASLPEPAHTALVEARTRLQAAVAHQVRLKRTPLLSFEADPAVAQGERVEEILRAIHAEEKTRAAGLDGGGPLSPTGDSEVGGEASGPGDTSAAGSAIAPPETIGPSGAEDEPATEADDSARGGTGQPRGQGRGA
jgi:ribosome-binding factor A